MRSIFNLATLVLALAILATSANAGVIALWDFNDQDFNADQGSGTASLVNLNFNWEDDPGKVDPQDPGFYSIELKDWPVQSAAAKISGMQFMASTVGHTGIKVKWDMRHNIKNGESSSNTSTFQYTTDGGLTWIDGPTWTSFGDQWYLNREVDLSSDTACDNNPDFGVRIVADWEPGAGQYMPCAGSNWGSNRKWRMDLITIHDDVAPSAPNTIALWDFNDQRDLVADYGDGVSQAQLVGGITFDDDGYQDDFFHNEELWDYTSSSDPSLKGKALDTKDYPAQSTGNKTAGLQFDVSTVGYSDIKVFFDIKHKKDSSRYIRVQYTTDKTASPVVWQDANPLFSNMIPDPSQDAWWFNNNSVDLTAFPGVDNNPNFAFRIVTEYDPAGNYYSASQFGRTYNSDVYYNKHRWDMIRVTAESTPPAFPVKTITEAKQVAQWQRVRIEDALVTDTHVDYFWVQEAGRNTGIKVYAPQHNMNAGWKVDLEGVTRVGRDTEKYIYANSVTRSDANTYAVEPVFMVNRNVGGGDWSYNGATGAGQVGVLGGVGLNNVGVFVKICGLVTAYVEEDDDPGYYDFMYVDDGSGLDDGNELGAGGTTAKGIRVVLPKNFSGDYLGKYVEVIGVSSIDRMETGPNTTARCIRRPAIREIN